MELLTIHASNPFIKHLMDLCLLLSKWCFTLIWLFSQVNFETLVKLPNVPVDVVHWVLAIELGLLEILDCKVKLD